jgi:hypothetical protein
MDHFLDSIEEDLLDDCFACQHKYTMCEVRSTTLDIAVETH